MSWMLVLALAGATPEPCAAPRACAVTVWEALPATRAAARPAREQAKPDRWVAEDKFRHLFMSLAATSLSHGAVRLVGVEDAAALAAAAAAASAAGLWKEWRDARTPGETASGKDLVWDAAGVALGVALAATTR